MKLDGDHILIAEKYSSTDSVLNYHFVSAVESTGCYEISSTKTSWKQLRTELPQSFTEFYGVST
jgi:hypothetical protein